MAKQLNVNLAFTADNRAAKAQIQELQQSLTKLISNTANQTSDFGLTKELAEAISQANQLKAILEKTSTASGGLDLGAFNSELKKSGLKLSDYAESLNSLGVEGQRAFAKMATAITQAGIPLKKTNAMLDEFVTTLKNTARWQISSSILHGFMGTLQSAVGYAQDLNESLNNIRIVTGYSTEEMAKFAEEANKSAKALSSTTTAYTNASLIYYQQGLSEEEVQKRTDITIKMANVARQSAEIVSDQMTAVWNNFYDGTKSLEYYADVMTALGAKTASSTDEIAGGLEKFAAIGDTIGLSYEYAASALATITSNTRQSEEVVGTALKTIFARIQGLNLGETLDDGTTLNKYSEALNKVGISIFNQAGELKTMDTLLDEMGDKWSTLNSAQQTALAQTVAGVRQYTQLVALMENWNNGDEDSFQTNLNTARTSSGALNQQADIYAESWEAARDRVQTAAEDIYQDLLDEDFFIAALNGFEKLLNAVDGLIDGLGGMPGVLVTLGSIITNVFGDEISQGLSDMLYNLTYNSQTAREEIEKLRDDAISTMKSLGDDSISGSTAVDIFSLQSNAQNELLLKQKELEQVGKALTEQEQLKAQLMLDTVTNLGEQVLKTAQLREAQEGVTEELIEQLRYEGNSSKVNLDEKIAKVKALQTTYATLSPVVTDARKAMNKINSTTDDEKKKIAIDALKQSLHEFASGAEKVGFSFDSLEADTKEFFNVLNTAPDSLTFDELQNQLIALQDDLYSIANDAKVVMNDLREALQGEGVDNQRIKAIMNDLSNSFSRTGKLTHEQIIQFKNLGITVDETGKIIKTFKGTTANFADGLTALSSQIMAVASAINAIKNLGSIWADDEATTGEKILSTITTIAVVLPTLTSAFNAQNRAKLTGLSLDGQSIAMTVAKIVGVKNEKLAHDMNTAAIWKEIAAQMLSNWYYAAAVAVIGLLVGAVYLLVDAYNADAEAAKKAAKTAKELADAHEEAKQSLDNLESAFNTYDTAIDALEECTKGTKEWDDALKNVNDTVLELISQYPTLLKDAELFSRNADGMLEISEAKREEILRAAQEQVNVTQAAALFGAATASQASVKSQATDTSRAIGNYYGVGDYNSTSQGGGYYDDVLNVGSILTSHAKELMDLEPDEYREKVAKLLRNAANDQAKTSANFDEQINVLVDKCMGYQSQIDTLAENTEAAANQMANAAQIIADQNLGNAFDTAEKTIAGKELAKIQQEIYEETLAQMKGSDISKASGADNAIYQDIARRLDNAGVGLSAATGNTVQGTDKNRKFVFLDAEGNRVTKDAEWVANQIAAAEALEKLGNSATEAKAALEEMDSKIKSISNNSNAGEAQSEILRGFITTHDFESGSMSDFSSLAKEIDDNRGTEGYIKAVFGENGRFNDELAQQYGFDTASEFVTAFNTNLSKMQKAWKTIELPDNLIGVDNLKFSTAKALNDVFYDIEIGPIGEKAGKQFTEGLNKMIKDLNADDQTSALNALANIDWSNWDALDQASTLMAEYGVNIDITSDYWKTFAENIRKATNAIPDFSKLQETLTAVAGVLADLNFGDVIDDEAYQTLIAYNAAWEEFFIMQADGSRKFIGSNELMLQAVRDRTNAEIESLKQRKAAQDAFNSVGWGYTDENGERQLTDWSKVEGTNIGTARVLMNAGGKTQATLEYLNYNDERIAELIAQAESSDEKIKTEGQAALKKMYDAISTLLGEDLETALDETYEQFASLAPDLKTLKSMLAEQEIDQAAYDKQLKSLLYAELEAAESYKQLNDALELARTHGIEWEPQYYAEKLKEIALNGIEAATSITELAIALQQAALHGAEISFDDYKEKLKELALGNLEAAASIEELQTAFVSSQQISVNGENFSTGINYEDYADNLIRLGEAYDNCKKEVEDFKRALANKKDVDAMEDSLEASIRLAEAAEKYGFEAKELEVQSRQLAKAYNLTAAAAAKLAVQNQRMNKGIVTLAENWKKWNKALTEAGTDTTDFAEAVIDCTAAVADLVGASADLELPDEFFNTENLALIEQAINGNIDAINRLGIEVALTQLEAVELNEAFATLAEETLSEVDGADYLGVLAENFATDVALIQQSLIDLKNSSLNITTEMSAEWVAALNRMALATGMSVENMNDLLGSMGVQAKVTTTYVKQPMEIPTYTDHYEEEYYNAPEFNEQNEMIRPASWSSRRYTIPGEPIKVEGYAAVAQISTEDNPLTLDIDEKTVEGSAPSTSSSGGGATWTPNRGKVAPSTAESVKEAQKVNVPDLKDRFEADDDELKKIEDEIERYYEVLNELEVVEDNLETISKAKDQAYGANKIALIDQETAALKRQLEVQREYIRQIKEYLKQDKDKLSTYGFMFNDDGNITNYEEIMQQQIEAYNAAYQAYINAKNAAVDTWNAATRGGPSEEADAAYDAAIKAADQLWETAQEKYETFQKELDLYDQTLEKMREAQQIEQDIINAVKAANFEKIQYKLEIKLEINDAEMRMLDYYLNKLSDDFYSMAEAAQLMVDKIPLITDALGSYESFYNEIEAAYAAGDISQEDYVAGLKQSYDGILDNLEALNELDKEMMHYYEDTLAAGAEELAHYTDQMEHLTSVLDHYYNLIVLINGEYDYDSIGTVLEGKATTLKNEMDVAQANYQMLLEQKAMIQSHYDNAVDENARELHANELKAITAMVDEAHEVLLSKTEEWAKVQKAIMENVMAEAAREMEMAFTDGMGFDALNDSLGRLSAIADIYLTKTNQIYETQTLLNTAQKAIDKTTNNAAKIRLKNYQDEIALLQDKNKLTKVELDIAKAKYDVLLAEIALEEAQNAKATVRLQRDNEGNYGYVYTADQEKVTEAEQNLLDTQNELYNIRLEAANEYGQKIMELNQQLADDLMALEQARVDGQFATEAEYQAAKEKIIAEYTELYKGYSASYAAATSEDARIEEEAWVTAYEGIIDSAGNWKDHIRIYTRECENAYSEYRSVVQNESSVINNLLGDVQGSVKDVTNESNNLKNKVLNEVIPSIRNQYTQVAQVTAAYAAQRTGILNLISAYEQLAQSILRAMQAQANLNALEQTPTSPTTTSAPTNTNKTPTNNTSQEDTSKNQKAAAIASRAQEIVTKVHTGVIPMHSSGLGWQPSAREMGYDEDSIKVALQAFNDSKPGAGWDYYYDIALQLAARYKTGGYTGVWGPEGRIALLDEKELVLNQHDTENFLMATEILRGIVDTIDFNSFHSQFSQLSSAGLLSMNSGALEQNVSIEAHFPNVSDRNEIEEAFNNLINTASQYANRKF